MLWKHSSRKIERKFVSSTTVLSLKAFAEFDVASIGGIWRSKSEQNSFFSCEAQQRDGASSLNQERNQLNEVSFKKSKLCLCYCRMI